MEDSKRKVRQGHGRESQHLTFLLATFAWKDSVTLHQKTKGQNDKPRSCSLSPHQKIRLTNAATKLTIPIPHPTPPALAPLTATPASTNPGPQPSITTCAACA